MTRHAAAIAPIRGGSTNVRTTRFGILITATASAKTGNQQMDA
jgi:hypothetical protein